MNSDLTKQLAVGTMNFGKRTNASESMRIIDRALERGLSLFDTANAYNDGDSERILGQAFKANGMRAKSQIATKVGFARIKGRPEGLAPERVLRAAEESLERLGTDVIDLYYLHVPDPHVPIGETLGAVHELLNRNVIRAWGVSNYASWQILEMRTICESTNMPYPTTAQQLYNILIRQLDIEYFAFARRFPIHTTVYNALAGGLLSGKHQRDSSIPKGSRFDGNTMYQKRYWTTRMFDVVDALSAIATSEQMSLVDMSYAWLAQKAGVDSILLGPASVAQLDTAIDATSAARNPISKESLAKIEEIHRAWQGTEASYAR